MIVSGVVFACPFSRKARCSGVLHEEVGAFRMVTLDVIMLRRVDAPKGERPVDSPYDHFTPERRV
jgi:hypothetical protein